MKKIYTYLFAFLLCCSNFSCSKDCGTALADLICEAAISAVSTIAVGIPFNVINLINNVPETLEKCKGDIIDTFTADESTSNIKVSLANSSGQYESVTNNNFSVPQIPSGNTAMEDYSLIINEPGEYQIITFADAELDVSERDENNNTADPVDIAGKKEKRGLIIKVLPNPNFKRSEGAPIVEILGRTVKVVPMNQVTR